MDWLTGAWAVFMKDVRLELRSRYAINMVLMFVLGALVLILYAVGQESVSDRVQSTLLWVIILFSAAVGLGRVFIQEEERGTVLLLQLNTTGSMVYAGKLLFNFLLMLAVNLVSMLGFVIILTLDVHSYSLLLLTLFLGALALAGATTLLAALIARTANSSQLLPVLLFPMLLVPLLSAVNGTRAALDTRFGWDAASLDLMSLASFSGLVITASVLLFDYVWKD